jgi:hypothetical protein
MRLKGVHLKGALWPNSELWLKLNFFIEGASLEIKKGQVLVYINIFCTEGKYAPKMFNTVQGLYKKYDLGFAQLPTVGTWIHSVPVNYAMLTEEEIGLCGKITTAFYWGVYAKRNKQNYPQN